MIENLYVQNTSLGKKREMWVQVPLGLPDKRGSVKKNALHSSWQWGSSPQQQFGLRILCLVSLLIYIYILASLDIASWILPDLWSPRQWRAENLFCCLSLGSSEQKGGVFLLLTCAKSQLEFFAFLGLKQRSAQLLRDGKPAWVGDSCDALLSPACICSRSPSSFHTHAFQIIGLSNGERIPRTLCLPGELSRETAPWNAPVLRQAWTTKCSYIWVVSTTFIWIF